MKLRGLLLLLVVVGSLLTVVTAPPPPPPPAARDLSLGEYQPGVSTVRLVIMRLDLDLWSTLRLPPWLSSSLRPNAETLN